MRLKRNWGVVRGESDKKGAEGKRGITENREVTKRMGRMEEELKEAKEGKERKDRGGEKERK